MGHSVTIQLDNNYLPVSVERLFSEFKKAIPALTIDKSEQLKIKNEILEKKNEQLSSVHSEALTMLSDKIIELEKKLE